MSGFLKVGFRPYGEGQVTLHKSLCALGPREAPRTLWLYVRGLTERHCFTSALVASRVQ